jgi:exodeoxyribonuclease VII large subunit
MNQLKLSKLVEQVQNAVQCFENQYYWVSAQVSGIKKFDGTRRCYLTLGEFENGIKVAEMKGVFWSAGYDEIAKFEKATGQQFKDGIEVVCRVMVRFNRVYGLNVEVFEISIAHTIGTLELQKKQTIEKLIKEGCATITDGSYKTKSNQLPLPVIIKNIALITAPNSDGQRDFIEEITKNRHGYKYNVEQFLTTIQGENAHNLILEQLKLVEKGGVSRYNKQGNLERIGGFDAVAIVRGGGSDSDLKPFDNYELAKYVANFPIPVFTGIGHDRNQSIVDLMAREQKTPTKVAAIFVEHNFATENKLIELCTKLFSSVNKKIQKEKDKLETKNVRLYGQAEREIRIEKLKLKALKTSTFKAVDGQVKKSFVKFTELKSGLYRTAESIIMGSWNNIWALSKTVKLLDPQTILNRGFAIVTFNNKTVTDSSEVEGGVEIQARLKNGTIYSTVIKK